MEEAVRLKEAGKATEIVAVSAGPPSARKPCAPRWRSAPTGILESNPTPTCSRWPSPSCSRPWSTREQPQLVILGKQAIDDDANQTGQMLAALLGWLQATFASKVEAGGDKRAGDPRDRRRPRDLACRCRR